LAEIKQIDINLIDLPDWDVRYIRAEAWERHFAGMIAKQGIREPLHVLVNEERYLLLEGRTRLSAAKRLGLEAVPCIIHDEVEPDPMLFAYHLNALKRGLGVVSVAKMAWELIFVRKMSVTEVAEELGISRQHVHRLLKLLKRDPKELREIELGLRPAWRKKRKKPHVSHDVTHGGKNASLTLRCVICGSEGQVGLGRVFFLCREHIDAEREFERAVIRYAGRLRREDGEP